MSYINWGFKSVWLCPPGVVNINVFWGWEGNNSRPPTSERSSKKRKVPLCVMRPTTAFNTDALTELHSQLSLLGGTYSLGNSPATKDWEGTSLRGRGEGCEMPVSFLEQRERKGQAEGLLNLGAKLTTWGSVYTPSYPAQDEQGVMGLCFVLRGSCFRRGGLLYRHLHLVCSQNMSPQPPQKRLLKEVSALTSTLRTVEWLIHSWTWQQY